MDKIALCGFMGCGKTGVGRRVAKILNFEFIDMDIYIEKSEGMPVKKIFEIKGEEYFRKLETLTIEKLAKKTNCIIATGGGVVLNPKNVEAFHKNGVKIIFIDAPLSALQERLKNDKKRPLLQRPDRREFIADLHKKRYPLYKSSSDIIVNGGAPSVVVAKEIVKIMKEIKA